MRPLHAPLPSPLTSIAVALFLFTSACSTTPTTSDTSAADRAAQLDTATVGATPAAPSSSTASPGSSADSEPVAVVWVNGMGCPLCANNVDEQLLAVPGVESVRINLGAGHAVTTLSRANPPTEAQLAAAIDRTGFTLVRIDMPR